jgi:hypothetical protein
MSYGRQSNGGRNTRINNDRFGNAYQLKTAYEVTNKKTGEVIDNHYKCTVELGGKLYRIEVSPRVKETKNGANAMWCKVTKINAQQRATSM